MSKQKWEVRTHEEKPNWGEGDYDEYYEIVNERGDSLQTTDNFDNLHIIADALNSFDGEIRITTALEINLHCETQLQKMDIETLKAENSKMRIVLQAIQKWANKLLTGQPNPPEAAETISHIEILATEALKTP